MAFNPFDVFRRNQKILFSILTVFVMFMFVLSFGKGDFFDLLPQWLGATKRGGAVLAVVDGAKVYGSELGQQSDRRTLANLYMTAAVAKAADGLDKFVRDAQGRASEDTKKAVAEVLQARQLGYVDQQTRQFAQMFGGLQRLTQFMSVEQIFAGVPGEIARLQQLLRGIATAPNARPEDAEVANAVLYIMALDQRATGERAMYFANQPNRNTRDQMDFYLWRKKADKLGIRLSDEDVDTLVKAEFFNQLKDDDLKALRDGLRDKVGYTPERLAAALADEFRVRAAQTAVLGRNFVTGGPLTRAYDAPVDFFTFYKEQLSPARYTLLPVPADNFLDKVTGTPTETDLRAIFTKARTVEPNPASPAAALKEPRKLKVAFVEAAATEPFYKAAAEDALKKADVMSRAIGLFTLPLPGVSVAAYPAGFAPLAQADLIVQAEYARYQASFRDGLGLNWGKSAAFGGTPADTSVVRPQVLAAATAAAAGGLLTGAPVLAAGGVMEATVAAIDRQERMKAFAGLLAVPTPGDWSAVVGGAGAVNARFPLPLPLGVVRPQLEARVREELARTLCTQDLAKFTEDLTKLGDKPAEAQAMVDKFIKERGLTAGQSVSARDRFTISDDPGLSKLKERAASASRGNAQAASQFGQQFFVDPDPTANPMSGAPRMVPSKGLYKPQGFRPTGNAAPLVAPQIGEPAVLAWRTADQPAETPRNFTDPGVKEKAEAAWKRAKARDLAKAAADELAAKCKDMGTAPIQIEQRLRDLRAEFVKQFPAPAAADRVSYFEIDNVAPLVLSPGLNPSQQNVSQFTLTPFPQVPYPTREMEAALVKGRDAAPGTAIVLADQPTDTHYVAVLLGKQDRSPMQFGFDVYSTFQPTGVSAGVSQLHQAELLRKARESAVALLKAEFGYDKEDEKAMADKSSADDF